MGVVYLGRHPETRRTIAIKTMALGREFDEVQLAEVKQRFFREAEAAGRLRHPHIVTVHDAGEDQDLAYIAMEYLSGHNLTRYCHPDNMLELDEIIQIILMAASALDYAHSNNVIHRDIKPANIMYDPETRDIKLTDFGTAHIVDSGITRSGKILGTPSYMSPEQLYGRQVDGRSDLFSLGVMLYEMITGRLPFTGASLAELMANIANNPHPDLLEEQPAIADLTPALASVIDRALRKNIEDRYQSGAEMLQDLLVCADALD